MAFSKKRCYLWGAFGLPLFVYLSACHCQPYWRMDATRSSCRHFNFGRITRESQGTHSARIEIHRTACGYDVFAVSTTRPLAHCKNDPTKIPLTLRVGTDTHAFCAERMGGGYKALLPLPAKDLLIQSLLHGDCVVLMMPGYRDVIHTREFPIVYANLQRLPVAYVSETSLPDSGPLGTDSEE